jgi:hypothetical protein
MPRKRTGRGRADSGVGITLSQSDSYRSLVGQTVEITWLDAFYDYEVPASEVDSIQLALVKTIGVLLYEDKTIVRIAGETIHRDGTEVTYRAVTSIPTCLVENLQPVIPA